MAFKNQSQQSKPEAEKPVQVFRAGALSVSIWAREHDGKTFYNANPQRAYTEDDGATWEHSGSFGRDDLATVATLLNMALAWIVTQGAKAQ